jgi:hypothetical protein
MGGFGKMLSLRMKSLGPLALALCALTLAACHSDDNSASTTTQSATGVWTGTDSTSGLDITGIVNSAGAATFIRSDGVQFDGTVQMSGSTLAATVTGYTAFGNTFSDGSTYGLGTLNGTVTTGSTLTATLTFTTSDNTSISGDWSLTYEGYSNSTSSQAAVAGNYTDTVTSAVLTITSSGVLTEQTASNNCVLNGSIATNDSTHNVYEVSYTLESCTGSYAALNGVQFTGLATLNNSVSPNQLIMAVSGSNSTSKYALVSVLNAS